MKSIHSATSPPLVVRRAKRYGAESCKQSLYLLAEYMTSFCLPALPICSTKCDLRHTAATLMLAARVSLTDVSKILGHSNPEVTARVYAHSLEANRRHAVEAVARLLNEGNR